MPEVRRCEKCQEPAVVLISEWKHTYWGAETQQATRDFRCQSCGTRFSLPPPLQSWVFIVMGLIMACGIGPLMFTYIGWRQLRREKINPVVPNAPLPPMRYRVGPPQRACRGCSQAVTLTHVTRHRINGLPAGTEFKFACSHCKKTFVIDSVWRQCLNGLMAALVAAIGAAFLLVADTPGWRYGGSGFAALIACVLIAQTALGINNRFKYPVIDGES
jgi:hypothetical protein